MQLEVLVEEPSATAALEILVPRIVGDAALVLPSWNIRQFSGKSDLLNKLPQRLKGYSSYANVVDLRILVLVDRDSDECVALKARLDGLATEAGLLTKTKANGGTFHVCNRIVIEELEAWFIGDHDAVVAAYPRVPASFPAQKAFRDPDAVTGGTCEALQRLLQKHGYHRGGLSKVACAREIGKWMNPDVNRSNSFNAFKDGLVELIA
jgi:hypothetical protein